ncbi:MAG: sulfotransferase [Myxococcota bacterium]
MEAPVFVVGTGRCGSTMLSEMLRAHPRRVSLSEFWSIVTDLGGRIAETFPDGPVTAEAFWDLIGGVHPMQATLLRHGVAMDEVLYRTGPGRRFTAESGIPAILQTVLPHLSGSPDALFDEVRSFVATLPTAPAAAQYRALFDWLAARFDRSGWIERSGGSLRIVARLHQAFPDARFVHLVRDGRDCAQSMSRHPGFRMALIGAQLTEILGVDPYTSPDRAGEGDLPDELVPFLPERFDPVAFVRYETPLTLCGHYWSGECMAGARELASVGSDRVLTLWYEDILAHPARALEQLDGFLGSGAGSSEWITRSAAAVRAPRSSWRALPPDALRELEEACAPGFAALGAG